MSALSANDYADRLTMWIEWELRAVSPMTLVRRFLESPNAHAFREDQVASHLAQFKAFTRERLLECAESLKPEQVKP